MTGVNEWLSFVKRNTLAEHSSAISLIVMSSVSLTLQGASLGG